MEEATKNTLKSLGFMLLGFGAFIAIAYLVPDDSNFKVWFGYFCGLVLVGLTLMFTPLGNPLKKLYRKWKGIE